MRFTLAWIVLGLANAGYTLWGVYVAHYSVVQQQLSALGIGSTGPFMNAAFITTGAHPIIGAIGIFRAMRATPVEPKT